ncbi:Rrf2 family transcriptional regulator [Flavobacteriales bacterium]|nr:Rrf2 family transcriptional regulator [Flavobacteriales bacterium]
MLTKKAQYALRALTVLTRRHEAEGPSLQWSSARDIADSATMSVKFLEQILGELRSAGIVKSRRGASGGHALSMAPDEVTLAKVIRLMDGPIAPLACVSLNYYERCEDCKEEECGLRRVMVESRDAQLSILEHRFLKDLT